MNRKRGKPTSAFKISRDYALQSTSVENELYTKITEQKRHIFLMGDLIKQVSRRDIACYFYALEQILYNQSIASNAKRNTGIRSISSNATKEERKAMDERVEHTLIRLSDTLAERGATDYERGAIETTLNELCRFAYGVNKPTSEQKERMKATIEAVENTKVNVVYLNSREERIIMELKLATVWSKKETKDPKTEKIIAPTRYGIEINPIFCNMKHGYALLPIDAMMRLTNATKEAGQRNTGAHIKLMQYFALHKQTTITRTEDVLFREMGINVQQCYKNKNIPRTREQLRNVFDILVRIGQLSKMPTMSTDKDGITTYSININPDFVHRV